jgi:hypothetical protein
VERLARFEEHRFVGDKRTQIVHDVDRCDDAGHLDHLLAADAGACFAPDTLAEARNRGYRLCGACARVRRSTT